MNVTADSAASCLYRAWTSEPATMSVMAPS